LSIIKQPVGLEVIIVVERETRDERDRTEPESERGERETRTHENYTYRTEN